MKYEFKRLLFKKKGSATIESIVIITLFLFMTLFVWQFVVAGIAIMETQDWLTRASRELSAGETETDVESRVQERFSTANYHTLRAISLKIDDGQVTVKAEISIHPVIKGFPSFPYQTEVVTPVLR
ncbi:hypothetical protein CEN49_21750 [Fischerella thermalis CCMEE 5273]|nr:hypothetical protein CEN49_21750 [Fischerella thermalis CCMEE 5273]